MPRDAQPLRSQQLRVTFQVTRTVTAKVICVFHAAVTISRSHSEGRTVRIHQKSVKEHGSVRPQLRELCSQVSLAKVAETPCPIEGLESIPVKTPASLIQEFKVRRHGDHILVVVPLLADLEVTQDFARHIRLQRPFHDCAEAVFGFLKISLLRGDIEKAETLELPEESL